MINPDLPHIILIIMDSVAAKRCSAYGYHRPTTPGLSRIAQEGVLYRHCFAPAPWTIPSHASLFSGLYPTGHGCDDKSLTLPDNFYSLPDILQQLGYHTVAISSNGLVNLQRGFDVFYEMDTLFTSETYHRTLMAVKSLIRKTGSEWGRLQLLLNHIRRHGSYHFLWQNPADRLYRRYFMDICWKSHGATAKTLKICQDLLARYRDQQPLFLFINMMDAHWRYNPPKNFNNIVNLPPQERQELMRYHPADFFVTGIPPQHMEKLALLYEQELVYLDSRILELYDFLKEQGLLDRTMFAVTADHGECLGEHGLWGHCFGLYNELLHIPLIVKYPAGTGVRGEHAGLVQLHDLYATILEVTGAPFPVPESSRSLLGESRDLALAEHLETSLCLSPCRERDPHFQPWPVMQPCRGIIDASRYKLLEWADGRLELYDLETDYGESLNLRDDPHHQGAVERLHRLLMEHLGPFPGEAGWK